MPGAAAPPMTGMMKAKWAGVGVVVVGIVAAVAAWQGEQWLKEYIYWLTVVRGQVLTAAQERVLKPGDTFKECADCPEMVVVSAGEFMMGSPADERDRLDNEGPLHKVALAKPFAVSRFEVTFAEWDACAAHGDCDPGVKDRWGRGRQPLSAVNWYDAQHYVAWLSRVTGRPYRLLSEAEWEYAARAGSSTAYPWGDEIGTGNANCNVCGSQWDGMQTAPVGSFAGNAFGLHDMHGNVWEWVEDCYHGNYHGAPADGSPWTDSGICHVRVVRGGSWYFLPANLRSALRGWFANNDRDSNFGLRVGRTLTLDP